MRLLARLPTGLAAARWPVPWQQAAACLSTASDAPLHPGVIEIRQYVLKPEGIKDYLQQTQEKAALRRQMLPLLGMFTCDTGGQLNKVTHMYTYKDLDERDAMRHAAASNAGWAQYVAAGRKHMQSQESNIMVEATRLYDAVGIRPAASFSPPSQTSPGPGPVVYELRHYQLHPGYGTTPKVLDALAEGLPEKISCDKDGALIMYAYSDVGTANQLVELWRYPSAGACIRARQASRTMQKWRNAIAAVTPHVQTFTSTFLNPVPGVGPWQ